MKYYCLCVFVLFSCVFDALYVCISYCSHLSMQERLFLSDIQLLLCYKSIIVQSLNAIKKLSNHYIQVQLKRHSSF